MHVSRLRKGRDLVVPLATRKVTMVLLPVLMLSISASKHPTRGTGSLCANTNNQASVRHTAIFFLSECWIFSSICSSMMLAVEHESASILHFTPLTRTSTVGQLWGQGLSSLTWMAKFLLFLFLDILCGWLWFRWRVFLVVFFCLYTCERNDLFSNTGHMFFQRRSK